MAEVIAVVGGLASVSQVLVYFTQITRYSISFYNDFTQAPRVLEQIEEKLHILQQTIEQLRSYAAGDEDVLPTEMKELLLRSVNRVQSSLNKAKLKCEPFTAGNIKKKKKRVTWVLRDEPALNKLLQDLNDSDHVLNMVMQLLTMKTTLLVLKDPSATLQRGNENEKPGQPPVSLAMTESRYMVYSWPWLQQFGFYGRVHSSHSQSLLDANIFLGYQFPTWLWSKSIEFELQLRIPSFLKMQNRVLADSPWMVACRQGDIDRMRQHLADKSGSVGDRLTCTGQTPLMLSIESGDIDAIKVLLDAGANPNVGDDDGITPIFFALGMNPRKKQNIFPQFPPRNPRWIDIIRLLVDHDASVHDEIHGNSVTTLNLVWQHNEHRTLEFFYLLQDQCYVDFGAERDGVWSACINALRSTDTSLKCLQFLKARGVDFSKISADGRSLLHFGAEFAHKQEVIEYLCEVCPPHYINRQDDLGWTPLHYAIAFEAIHRPQDSLAKVKFLVRRGADPSITARCSPLVSIDKDHFTVFELGEILRSDQYEKFLEILKDCGHEIPEEAQGNVFYEIVS